MDPRSNSQLPEPSQETDFSVLSSLYENFIKYNFQATQPPRVVNRSQAENAPSRLEYLAQPRTALIEKREKIRRQLDEECTFQPEINRRPHELSRSVSDCPVEVRLYHDATQKRMQQEKLRRECLEAQTSAYDFQPHLQSQFSSKSSVDRLPIHLRSADLHKKKLDALRSSQELPSFRPTINPRSQQLAAARKSRSQFGSLWEPSCDQTFDQSSEQSIAPSEQSRSISKPSDEFMQRQQALQEKLKRRAEGVEKYSFQPMIDKHSQVLAAVDRPQESWDAKVQRWTQDEANKREAKQKQVEAELYSQYTFEPSINPHSKQIGRTVDPVAYFEQLQQKRKEQAKTQAELLERSCSFTPQTTNAYRQVKSNYSQAEDLMAGIQREQMLKNAKLAEARLQIQGEVLQDCTFQPELQARVAVPRTAEVKGLDRFLELKELARKQELEQRQREEKVFKGNPRFVPPSPHTIPQPFNLQPSRKEEKLRKIIEELPDECTFKPQKFA